MKFQSILLNYLNSVVNKYSNVSNADNRVKVNYVVTIKPGGSYATMKGGRIKAKNSIDASQSDDSVHIINIININKNELDTIESWQNETLLDKYKMGESSGIFSDVSYGTISTFLNIVLHEITHAANYHVYSKPFGKLIEFYIRNRKTALSSVYEVYPEGLLNMLNDRFLKSKEVFYLYGYNNFVRAWAEVEAGSAGFTANVFASAFVLRFLYYLMFGSKKVENDSHKILVNQNQYSINPYAFIYKMIVDAIVSKISDKEFFLAKKFDLHDTLFNYLSSSEAIKDYGSGNNLLSLIHVQNIIANIFKPRYGFFRAAKILFAVDEGAEYYNDFVRVFASGVSNDIVYYYVKYLTSSKFLNRFLNFIKNKIEEYESFVSSGNEPAKFFESNVRKEIMNMATEMIYVCAINIVKDLAGDLEIGANYSGLWLQAITNYDYLPTLSNFADDVVNILLREGNQTKSGDNIKYLLDNIIYLMGDKTKSYDYIKRLMSSIYSAIGANENYFESIIEGGGTLKAVSSLNISNSTIVAINTYTEVYPISGSASANSKIFESLSNAQIDTSKSISKMAVRISDLSKIKSYSARFYSSLPRENLRYTGSVFFLIMFLCYNAVNWAYEIIGKLEYGKYRDLLKGNFDVNNYLSVIKRFIENTDHVMLSMQKMYIDNVSNIISSIDTKGLRNVSGFSAAINNLYPANFSDLVVLYKSVGAQFRLLELIYKFFDDLDGNKFGDIHSLIKEKNELIKDIEKIKRNQSDKRDSEILNNKIDKLNILQGNIDSLILSAVDKFIFDIVDLENYIKEIMIGKGQVDEEEEEEEEEKKKEDDEKKQEEPYKFSEEEIRNLVTAMIYNNSNLGDVFETVVNVVFSGKKDTYDEVMNNNPIGGDFENKLPEIKPKADSYLSVMSEIPDMMTYLAENGKEKMKSLRKKYPDYAKDIEKIENLYGNILYQFAY
ncbi:MAG: hypothetical protein QXF12_00125 [Candidatus Aenigmatarchaeota archaeon]